MILRTVFRVRPNGGSGREGAVGRSGLRITSISRLAGVVAFWTALQAVTDAATAVVITRSLPVAQRGGFVVVVTVVSLLALFATGGVSLAGRMLLVHSVPLSLASYLSLSVVLGGAVALVVAAMTPAVVGSIDYNLPAAPIVSATLAFSLAVAMLLTGALYAYGRASAAAATTVVGSAAGLVGALAVMAGNSSTDTAFLVTVILDSVVQAAMALWLLVRGNPAVLRWSTRGWRRLMREGATSSIVGVAHMVAFKLDRYLIGIFEGARAVAVYSVAASVTELLWLAPTALTQVLFHRHATATTSEAESKRIRRTWLIGVSGSALVVLVSAPLVIPRIFGSEYGASLPATRILLVGALAIASYSIDSTAIIASRGIRLINNVAMGGAVVVVAGNMLLLPVFGGIEVAAFISVGAYVGMATAARVSRRRLGLA